MSPAPTSGTGDSPRDTATDATGAGVPDGLCGEEFPILVSQFPKTCTKPKGHHVHMCRGHAWETDWDAWRAQIEQEVRAKVAEDGQRLARQMRDGIADEVEQAAEQFAARRPEGAAEVAILRWMADKIRRGERP